MSVQSALDKIIKDLVASGNVEQAEAAMDAVREGNQVPATHKGWQAARERVQTAAVFRDTGKTKNIPADKVRAAISATLKAQAQEKAEAETAKVTKKAQKEATAAKNAVVKKTTTKKTTAVKKPAGTAKATGTAKKSAAVASETSGTRAAAAKPPATSTSAATKSPPRTQAPQTASKPSTPRTGASPARTASKAAKPASGVGAGAGKPAGAQKLAAALSESVQTTKPWTPTTTGTGPQGLAASFAAQNAVGPSMPGQRAIPSVTGGPYLGVEPMPRAINPNARFVASAIPEGQAPGAAYGQMRPGATASPALATSASATRVPGTGATPFNPMLGRTGTGGAVSPAMVPNPGFFKSAAGVPSAVKTLGYGKSLARIGGGGLGGLFAGQLAAMGAEKLGADDWVQRGLTGAGAGAGIGAAIAGIPSVGIGAPVGAAIGGGVGALAGVLMGGGGGSKGDFDEASIKALPGVSDSTKNTLIAKYNLMLAAGFSKKDAAAQAQQDAVSMWENETRNTERVTNMLALQGMVANYAAPYADDAATAAQFEHSVRTRQASEQDPALQNAFRSQADLQLARDQKLGSVMAQTNLMSPLFYLQDQAAAGMYQQPGGTGLGDVASQFGFAPAQ